MNNILSSIRNIISDYNRFCDIDEKIKWINIYEKHEDWFNIYPLGICIDIFEFLKGYIQKNIDFAYVRAILDNIALRLYTKS